MTIWKNLKLQEVEVDLAKSLVSGFGARVETGAVRLHYSGQPDDDWPALFLRGDAAISLFMALDCVLKMLPTDDTITDEMLQEDTIEARRVSQIMARRELIALRELILNDVAAAP